MYLIPPPLRHTHTHTHKYGDRKRDKERRERPPAYNQSYTEMGFTFFYKDNLTRRQWEAIEQTNTHLWRSHLTTPISKSPPFFFLNATFVHVLTYGTNMRRKSRRKRNTKE